MAVGTARQRGLRPAVGGLLAGRIVRHGVCSDSLFYVDSAHGLITLTATGDYPISVGYLPTSMRPHPGTRAPGTARRSPHVGALPARSRRVASAVRRRNPGTSPGHAASYAAA